MLELIYTLCAWNSLKYLQIHDANCHEWWVAWRSTTCIKVKCISLDQCLKITRQKGANKYFARWDFSMCKFFFSLKPLHCQAVSCSYLLGYFTSSDERCQTHPEPNSQKTKCYLFPRRCLLISVALGNNEWASFCPVGEYCKKCRRSFRGHWDHEIFSQLVWRRSWVSK